MTWCLKCFFDSKLSKGGQVGLHVVKTIAYIKRLVSLGFIIDNELVIYQGLKSLPKSWANFIMNFNLNEKEKSLDELLYMLKTTEQEVYKTASTNMLMVEVKAPKVKGKAKPKPKAKK